MSVIRNELLLATDEGGYNLTKSLRFRSSASAYLNRTPSSASNQKTWTYSAWVKRGTLGASSYFVFMNAGTTYMRFEGDQIYCNFRNGATNYFLASNAVYRDPSAWYHIMVVLDTTQATAANRAKLYVNGVQVTSLADTSYTSMAQNFDANINAATGHWICSYGGTTQYTDGYITEVNFVDGQALTPTSFGANDATTGVWQPAKYTGTYGTNGFYLPFTNTTSTTTLGYDFSGNSNNWTTNNFSLTAGSTYDSMTDVPTLTSATVANYCVLNPLNSTATISNGNLSSTAGASYIDALATIACISGSGKWYFEGTVTALTTTAWIGVTKSTNSGLDHTSVDSFRTVYQANGFVYRSGTGLPDTNTGTTYTTNDVIGIALDSVNGSISFYKNNTLVNTTTDALYSSNSFFFYTGQNLATWAVNFGQRPFTYTPPTGYVALNTYNLPTSTIVAGNKYMDIKTYTGDGTDTNSQTGLNFQPDLLWFKRRDATGYYHELHDAVRGADKALFSNATDVESTRNSLVSFNSNGFTVGTQGGLHGGTNASGGSYIAWAWDANGTGSSNTSGSITSTVSVNAAAGFSIVSYTGTGSSATVGHGLGVAPSMIIVKCRSASGSEWVVWVNGFTVSDLLQLSSTAAKQTVSNYWGSNLPSSTVFSLPNASYDNNRSGQTMIAYCWAEIAGFSKFGSYTGNGSTDGPFIYTGFRPKFVMIKRTDSTSNWGMWDSVRGYYNVNQNFIRANTSDEETTTDSTLALDFVSNGIKIRGTWQGENASGGSFIYAAFAENPTKFALAR